MLEYPSDPWNSKLLACAMLVFTMGLVYSLMAPLVVPIVTFYAGISLLVTRNQLRYVYVPDYESGGAFWIPFARSFVFAAVLFQLSMMGIFVLNKKPVCTGLVVPAIAITIGTARYYDAVYNESMQALPLATARTFDILNALQREKGASGDESESPKVCYAHPLLTRPARDFLEEESKAGEGGFDSVQDEEDEKKVQQT